MTPTDFAYCGLAFLTPANQEPELGDSTLEQRRQLMNCLTAALRECAQINPLFYKRPESYLLRAPESVTINVTRGANTCAPTLGSAAFENWMAIDIEGDASWNEIYLRDEVYYLRRPYAGTTGTKTARLLHDSFPFSYGVREVAGPVTAGEFELTKCANLADALRTGGSLFEPDYGRRLRGRAVKKAIGTPSYYWVETGFVGEFQNRIKVLPIPSADTVIEFVANILPPSFDLEDIGTDNEPSEVEIHAPDDSAETILKPIFLKWWFATPWLRNHSAEAQIKSQYATAVKLLEATKPQRVTRSQFVPPFTRNRF